LLLTVILNHVGQCIYNENHHKRFLEIIGGQMESLNL